MALTTVVGYQGEPGAFSESAARSYFGTRVALRPLATFEEVFAFADRGRGRVGIVPIENSLYGSIHQNYDLLLKYRLAVAGEVTLRIRLHLMALPGAKLSGVRHIYSQPQALGQCEEFLSRLRRVQVHVHHDTAGAARFVRESGRPDVAAIAGPRAAKPNGLRVVKRNVETHHRNYTRFIIVARRPRLPARPGKTLLVFALKNVPGALFQALQVFAEQGINLQKIESRPLVGRPWEYLFYVDVEGDARRDPLRRALKYVQELSTFVRVLGTFARGATVE